MHGRVPPMSGGITILYSIAIWTHCPTLLTPPPLHWLDICFDILSKLGVCKQWTGGLEWNGGVTFDPNSMYTSYMLKTLANNNGTSFTKKNTCMPISKCQID